MIEQNFKNERWLELDDSIRHSYLTPKIPGIYCFIEYNQFTNKKTVVYVGKSMNLSIRLKPWHKVEHIYSDIKNNIGDYLRVKIMPTNNLHTKEIEYIKRLKPLFNVKHNPIIKRKIIYENGKTIY